MPNWEFAVYTQTETKKYRLLVDTGRRYGYNTYRVRPKRSAVDTVLELPYLGNNRPDDSRAVIYVGTLWSLSSLFHALAQEWAQ